MIILHIIFNDEYNVNIRLVSVISLNIILHIIFNEEYNVKNYIQWSPPPKNIAIQFKKIIKI